MADILTINETLQLGAETTAGQAPGGGSNKLITDIICDVEPDFGTAQFRGTGRRFDALSVPTMEYSKLKWSGPLSYRSLVYPWASCFGAATITTPAGGVNARKWAFPIPLTGAIGPKTLQIQRGSSARARQVNYGVTTDVQLDFTRKDSKLGGGGIAQQVQDGISLTASPTAIAMAPVLPEDWQVFLDMSSASIGSTLLSRCYSAGFAATGFYAPNWPLIRANASFTVALDTPPKVSLKLLVMADSNGEALWVTARAAGKVYIRLEASSASANGARYVDNYQTLTISGGPTGGTFTLTYKGQTTSALAYNASSAAVQAALLALSTIGATGCTVSGSNGGPYTVTMTGALANDTTALTHTDSFTGGASPALAVVVTSIPFSCVLDMAAVPVPGAYKDEQGAWTHEYEFHIVEDTAWTEAGASGTGVYGYLQNDLTAL